MGIVRAALSRQHDEGIHKARSGSGAHSKINRGKGGCVVEKPRGAVGEHHRAHCRVDLERVSEGGETEKMSTPIEAEAEQPWQGNRGDSRSPPWIASATGKYEVGQLPVGDLACRMEHDEDSGKVDPGCDAAVSSTATLLDSESSGEATCTPAQKMSEDAKNGPLWIPVGANFPEGIGQCTSLQQLLLGFTTGVLCLNKKQNDLSEFRRPETCLEQGYAQSEEETEHEDSVHETSYGGSDEDNNERSNDMTKRMCFYGCCDGQSEEMDSENMKHTYVDSVNNVEPKGHEMFIENQQDLGSVDWDRFYSTGELVKKTDSVDKQITADACVETRPTEYKTVWKKRRRVKDASIRKNFRMPRGMGAAEKAMRQYCDKKEGNIFEPRVGLEFDSEAEAIEYYNLYSWEVGFGIRKGNVDGNKSGYVTVRDVVCQRQGYDKRTKTRTKRCHCKAMIRLHH